MKELPIEVMSQKAFDSLDEYSCSVPTGQRIGKVWKCKVDYYDESQGWLIREYVSHPDPRKVGISTRRIQIDSSSLQEKGPVPHGYH